MKLFDPLGDIREFHEHFDLSYHGAPRELPLDIKEFRSVFMLEELLEYAGVDDHTKKHMINTLRRHVNLFDAPSLEQELDALVDLAYVVLGTAYMQGFNKFGEAWNRVHEANMKKVRAQSVDESSRSCTLDVVKPEGWCPPSLADLVAS